MYPVWAAAALAVIFLLAAIALFVGRFRRAGVALVVLAVVLGIAGVGMYVVAEIRLDDCAKQSDPVTDPFSYCERTVFGDVERSTLP